jgi:nitrile hydratase subunit beta
MDGIHDLGGRQGFGPVDVDEPEEVFHEAWEGRVWGIVKAMRRLPDWNIDWFRHCRELIDPVDYLTRPYFDQWAQTYAAMLVNSGVATVEEVASGRSQSAISGLEPPMPPEAVEQAKSKPMHFNRESVAEPALAVGNVIRARPHGATGHTRLPAYVRGRRGVIEAWHGAHVHPDAKAHGQDRAEPLYTVAFDAAELWPEAVGRHDRVFLDLWESYLERA